MPTAPGYERRKDEQERVDSKVWIFPEGYMKNEGENHYYCQQRGGKRRKPGLDAGQHR